MIWAVVSAVLYPIVGVWQSWLWDVGFVGLPLAILGGAGVGALIEWQLDD